MRPRRDQNGEVIEARGPADVRRGRGAREREQRVVRPSARNAEPHAARAPAEHGEAEVRLVEANRAVHVLDRRWTAPMVVDGCIRTPDCWSRAAPRGAFRRAR